MSETDALDWDEWMELTDEQQEAIVDREVSEYAVVRGPERSQARSRTADAPGSTVAVSRRLMSGRTAPTSSAR